MKRIAVFVLLVALVCALAGEPTHVLAQKTSPSGFNYFHFTAPSTGVADQIDAAPGTLHTITINTNAGGGFFEVADTAGPCTTSTPANVAVIPIASSGPSVTLTYDLAFKNGLCVFAPVPSSIDVTVTYQ